MPDRCYAEMCGNWTGQGCAYELLDVEPDVAVPDEHRDHDIHGPVIEVHTEQLDRPGPGLRLPAELHRLRDRGCGPMIAPTATDPERFADALLRASLALASLVGPEHSWAVVQRLASFDGTQR